MTSRTLKNLLNLFILLSLFVVLYILISGGQTLYISDMKIRLNHIHNPLLIFSILLALRLSLFKNQEFFLNKTILNFSQKYTEFLNKDSKKEYLIYFFLIIAFITLSYFRIFDNFFIREDFSHLEEVIKTNENFLDIFSLRLSNLFRPFFNLLFLLNYKISGLNPLGYYIVNYLIHIGNSILLFYFTYILTKNRFISFLASLIFAVNFEHYQAVMQISCRPNSGSAMFYLFTFIFFSKYLISKNKALYIASIIAFGLSLLHYEGTVTVVPMMLLYDAIFHERFNFSNFPRFIKRHSIFIILLTSYLALEFFIQSKNPLNNPVLANKVYVFNLHFLYQIFRSTITINEWIIPLLIVFVIFLIKDLDKKTVTGLFNSPVLLFSFLWIIIALVPFSFFQNRSIVVSRYFYIPSIGSSILLSLLIYRIYQTGKQLMTDKGISDKLLHNKFTTAVITVAIVIILANTLAIYQQESFFGKKPNWRKIISTLQSEYQPFPEHSQIYFMNISTPEVSVKSLMHVFFSPTIETTSSKTGHIEIKKTDPANRKKVFVFDYVNGEIVDRTADYIDSILKKIPYP